MPPPVLTRPDDSLTEQNQTSEWEEEKRRKKGGESKKRPAGSPTGNPREHRAKRNCEIDVKFIQALRRLGEPWGEYGRKEGGGGS